MEEKCICEVSESEEKLIDEGSYVNLYISRDEYGYWINAIADGRASMKIDYCPKCGRKLSDDE